MMVESESGIPDPFGAGDRTQLRRRLLVPTLVLSGSLMSVVSSLGANLVPTLSRAEGVSLSTGEWILTITLLTGALATPVMGRLADGPRQRTVILVALTSVVVGCVVSAVSNWVRRVAHRTGLPGGGSRALAGGYGHGPPQPDTGVSPEDHRHALGLHRHRGRSWLSDSGADRSDPELPGGVLVRSHHRGRRPGPRGAGPANPLCSPLPSLRRRRGRSAQLGDHRDLVGAQRRGRMGLVLASLPRGDGGLRCAPGDLDPLRAALRRAAGHSAPGP